MSGWLPCIILIFHTQLHLNDQEPKAPSAAAPPIWAMYRESENPGNREVNGRMPPSASAFTSTSENRSNH